MLFGERHCKIQVFIASAVFRFLLDDTVRFAKLSDVACEAEYFSIGKFFSEIYMNEEVHAMVKISGKSCNAKGKLIAVYLSEEGYDLKRVAVEKNGEIVPKSQYENTAFENGDIVEIVSFVGGG